MAKKATKELLSPSLIDREIGQPFYLEAFQKSY